jgi:hypothetical protein
MPQPVKVTDPEILRQLNGGGPAAPSPQPTVPAQRPGPTIGAPIMTFPVDPTKQAAEARAQAGEARAIEDQAFQREKFRLEQDRAERQEDRAEAGTVDERRIATLLTRIAGGFNDIQTTTDKHPDAATPGLTEALRGDLMPGGVGGLVMRGIAGGDRRAVHDAQRDVLDALLTLGTGAAYNAEQLSGQMASYFPQYGDTEAEANLKNTRLLRLIEAAKANAGPAWRRVEGAIAPFMESIQQEPETGVREPAQRDIYADGIQFNVDKGDPEARRAAYILEHYGMTEDQEDRMVGFWNANGGNQGLTVANVRDWYNQNGIPLPTDADIQTAIDGAKANHKFGHFSVQQQADEELAPAPPPDVRSREGGFGQSVDAAMRGAADIVTMGNADELSAAADTIFGDGTMSGNLAYQRGIDRFDEENNLKARLAGQFGGALLLPGPKGGGIVRNAGVGAAYGGAYGFGSANGDIGDRVAGLGTGAAIGAATGGVAGAVGRYLGRERPPPGGPGGSPRGPSVSAQEATELSETTGIPIMTSDVLPPKTFLGRNAQTISENIPYAGTGGLRGAQQDARTQAAVSMLDEFGGLSGTPAIDRVMADLASQRGDALTRWTNVKKGIKRQLADSGPVQVGQTIQAISRQIAALKRIDTKAARQVIEELRNWGFALTGKGIDEIEAIRKDMGAAFTAPELAAARDTGEQALSAIYNPMRQDIAAHVEQHAGKEGLARWNAANKNLARMAGETRTSGLRRVLQTGQATPEDVGKLLFSGKPSEIRVLYNGLSETGRANARAAIMQRVFEKLGSDAEEISPDRFLTELKRVGKPIGVFFEGADANRVTGLMRAIQLTRRAAQASAAPPTGKQNLPFLMGLSVPLTGGLSAAIGVTAGLMARVYESRPVRTALLKLARSKAGSSQETQAYREVRQAVAEAAIDPAVSQFPPQAANDATAGSIAATR